MNYSRYCFRSNFASLDKKPPILLKTKTLLNVKNKGAQGNPLWLVQEAQTTVIFCSISPQVLPQLFIYKVPHR